MRGGIWFRRFCVLGESFKNLWQCPTRDQPVQRCRWTVSSTETNNEFNPYNQQWNIRGKVTCEIWHIEKNNLGLLANSFPGSLSYTCRISSNSLPLLARPTALPTNSLKSENVSGYASASCKSCNNYGLDVCLGTVGSRNYVRNHYYRFQCQWEERACFARQTFNNLLVLTFRSVLYRRQWDRPKDQETA